MITYRDVLYEYVTMTIGCLAILANGAEIYLILKSKANKLQALIFILNLSFSDFAAGILMVLLKAMHPYLKTSLKGNQPAKDTYDFIKFVCIRFSLFISVFTLIALTFDRVIAVTKPFYCRYRTGSIPIIICVGIWLGSIAGITTLYSVLKSNGKNSSQYVNLFITVSVFLATVVFIICYGIIIHHLKRRQSRVDSIGMIIPNPSIQATDSSEMKINNIRNHKREVKVMMVAAKNVSIFLICWGPLAISSIFRADRSTEISIDVHTTFFTLAYLSVLINPLHYLFSSRKKLKSHK